jgi:hypothetical protein
VRMLLRLTLLLVGGVKAWAASLTPRQLAAVAGESCPSPLPIAQNCRATQEIFLVVDRSFSRLAVFNDVKSFLIQFVDEFALVPGDSLSPRLGLVSFHGAGPIMWSTEQSTAIESPLSDDRTSLVAAINNMADPLQTCNNDGGCTCISCGLERAWDEMLTSARADVNRVVIIFTDAEQVLLAPDASPALSEPISRA